MNQYDYIKYGIGIGTNTSEIDFGNLVFASGLIVSVNHGQVAPLTADVYADWTLQTGHEYRSNPIFASLADTTTDRYVVTIPRSKSGEIVDLQIKQTAPHVRGYILVIIETGAHVTVREIRAQQQFHGIIVDVVVQAGASCTYIIEHNESSRSELPVYTFGIHTARVMADAQMTWIDMNLAGTLTKHSIVTELVAAGAAAHTYGMFLGKERQVYDLYTATEHVAPHTTSHMLVRGILTDASRCVYRGLVKVHPDAKGSSGYEQADTLLLSPDATISSVPDLEILNNDVRCSHGVTVSHIDDEKLFYAQSRGMKKKDAEQQFILGHIGPILTVVPAALQETYREMIEGYLTKE